MNVLLSFLLIGLSLNESQRSKKGKYPRLELWNGNSKTISNSNTLKLMEEFCLTESAIQEICDRFPAVLNLDPNSFVLPKLHYLKKCILNDMDHRINDIQYYPEYFGHSLEKNIALKHAYLCWKNSSISKTVLLDDGCYFLRKISTLSEIAFCNQIAKTSIEEFVGFRSSFLQGGLSNVRNMDYSMLQILTEHGWDPASETDRAGRTTLMWACSLGLHPSAVHIVRLLLNTVRRLHGHHDCMEWASRLSDSGDSCLHFASTGGSLSICKLLLEEAGIDEATVHKGNLEGSTPLHWAAGSGSSEILQWLVEHQQCNIEQRNVFGCSAVHFASSGGQLAAMQYLHAVGANLSAENLHGHDPLTKAVSYCRNDVAEWLLNSLPAARDSLNRLRRWTEDPRGNKMRVDKSTNCINLDFIYLFRKSLNRYASTITINDPNIEP